jgi:benzoyl-CoA 2,3-dioxygenase component B
MLIPNNIGLTSNAPLHRQLVAYQTKFRRWWRDRGPSEFLEQPMPLRLPTGQTRGSGWATTKVMRPNDYVWGIFTVPRAHHQIVFGDAAGKPAWTTVPDECRQILLEHVCVQADVENAAIEQSRTLTRSVPSGADLHNLFQFFLEEGRHTWAMVHLLLEHFGSEGQVQAEALLNRMSGDTEHPRLLGAFNVHTEDWLSHFMWCFLADRVGKYQIHAVTQSAFLPLAESARFMMLEEPLHITFGLKGLERVLAHSVEVTRRRDRLDILEDNAIPLPVFQKYFNFWMSKIHDLFGNDDSSRSHDLYRLGIRAPRGMEGGEEEIEIDVRVGVDVETHRVPAACATNVIMRRQYEAEVGRIVGRWNDAIRLAGVDFTLTVPHERFAREHGACRQMPFDVDGVLLPESEAHRLEARVPSAEDREGVAALMNRELGDNRVAGWIAPPGTRLDHLCPSVATGRLK